MNEKIEALALKHNFTKQNLEDYPGIATFAEAIVQETTNLLQQEWYNLNNAPEVENESPRDVGYRVGRKSEIITLMGKIKNHFGIK